MALLGEGEKGEREEGGERGEGGEREEGGERGERGGRKVEDWSMVSSTEKVPLIYHTLQSHAHSLWLIGPSQLLPW